VPADAIAERVCDDPFAMSALRQIVDDGLRMPRPRDDREPPALLFDVARYPV
jgi:hypothetical protein